MRICLLLLLLSTFSLLNAKVSWKSALKQKADWYHSEEARDLAAKVILYQRSNGGWPKNQDFSINLDQDELKSLAKKRKDPKETTIDNGATYTPLKFLTRVWQTHHDPVIESSLHRGLAFLLKSQYPNGGWPQRPHTSGYGLHITYNDNAMIGVMTYLRNLVEDSPDFLKDEEEASIKKALKLGLDCILKTQIRVDGKPTVWCAQYDAKTLLPAKARSYEHPSFSGAESAGIVRYLMEIKDPSPKIRQSIDGAVAWFRAHQITGIRIVKKDGDKTVIKDRNAPPLWARFSDLKSGKPIFSGRDGIIKSSITEIEAERRNGYAWYVGHPRTILKDYPEWIESLQK
jgi:pectinesterase